MNNYLITGYWGEPHVTAENIRGFNAAVFGPGRFVLPVGEQLRAEYIGNNTVRLYDGHLLDNGAQGGIPAGKYVDLLIPEAGQGMSRNDLIIFQYSKDTSTLVESGIFTVVRGAEISGAATDPELTQADLLTDEATFDQMALYRIPVTGASIGEPVPLFDLARNVNSATSGALNLLDNSDFRNPVNSNGKTSYRGLGFSIDRWVVPNDTAALTVGDGFVLMQNDNTGSAATFVNRLRPGTLKAGKTYTGVICFNDGTVVFGSGVCSGSGNVTLTDATKNIFMQIAISADYDPVSLVVAAGKYDRLFYAALYEGEYTESTLPAYVPKGYGAEVANCHAVTYGGFETMVLLWENASPDSDFAGQTVSLDLSAYTHIMVQTATPASNNIVHMGMEEGELQSFSGTIASGSIQGRARKITVAEDGVTFGAGYYKNVSSTSAGSGKASLLRPIRIYGIKGVK